MFSSDWPRAGAFQWILARAQVIAEREVRLNQRIEELGCTMADELLRPTAIYAKIAVELFAKFQNQGAGEYHRRWRVGKPPARDAREKFKPWSSAEAGRSHRFFSLLQRMAGIDQEEMDHTFNNGLGMVAIAAGADADRIMTLLRRRKCAAYVIGEVQRGPRSVILK